MKPFSALAADVLHRIRGVFFDIDDTLTTEGRLTAQAYAAMERLKDSGRIVVPLTGRPAGWCDHIARMWPVDAVVGENGAFYFHYDHETREMRKRFLQSEQERAKHRRQLEALRTIILSEVPGAGVSSDQLYREADLAIDYCEDVSPLPQAEVEKIVKLFEKAGATAKISSIHVNGWFGNYDKITMTRLMMREHFEINLDEAKDKFMFIGDSPNDAPSFAYFPHAVGVANIRDFANRLKTEPAYVTDKRCGGGFAEVVQALLSAK
ncbi:MAG: HAD-IIB family hydrolase [Acidiferrobacterales bacterium]|nr:HAD-IIB family hydrolase [Acidiferrobacterales bacterium]